MDTATADPDFRSEAQAAIVRRLGQLSDCLDLLIESTNRAQVGCKRALEVIAACPESERKVAIEDAGFGADVVNGLGVLAESLQQYEKALRGVAVSRATPTSCGSCGDAGIEVDADGLCDGCARQHELAARAFDDLPPVLRPHAFACGCSTTTSDDGSGLCNDHFYAVFR